MPYTYWPVTKISWPDSPYFLIYCPKTWGYPDRSRLRKQTAAARWGSGIQTCCPIQPWPSASGAANDLDNLTLWGNIWKIRRIRPWHFGDMSIRVWHSYGICNFCKKFLFAMFLLHKLHKMLQKSEKIVFIYFEASFRLNKAIPMCNLNILTLD